MNNPLGFSGRIAALFLDAQITPLLALLGLLLGFFAILVTPREEEPQIDVTFANVFIPFPGATAREIEQLITTPAEQVLSEIEGVKHIYSVSRPGQAVLTVEYAVGEQRTQAIVRLYNAIFSNQDWLPPNLGNLQPLIKPKGIDDVPIVTLTLWSENPDYGVGQLQHLAHALEAELKRVPGTREINTLGGNDQVIHILLDPQRMAGYGIAYDGLRTALQVTNQAADSGALVSDNREIKVRSGEFLRNAEAVAGLVIGMRDGAPVYLRDVAEVRAGSDDPRQYVWFGTGPEAVQKDIPVQGEFPAVTLAIGKKPGTNAVEIADAILSRTQHLEGIVIPEGVNYTVTRNYGVTANEKAHTLITKLVFATALVVGLVLIALGWREAVIVGLAVIITLALTLFASWAWGFTLNRVSLFALIFSIGILVDDAIVVVENIHRHLQMGSDRLMAVIPRAVDEVGGPTILATLTVIAALLPMAFVTGLMGPYMSPIPINASIGMLISLAVAFVITPWLAGHLIRHQETHQPAAQAGLYPWFQRFLGPFLDEERGARRRLWLGLALLVMIVLSLGMAVNQWVILKMLPFDNKSEFQIVLDMPEGTPLEQTSRVLDGMAAVVASVPEVTDYQVYAGTSAPINFNGLVRQYYLRRQSNMGDIQVNLVAKGERDRKSHEIAQSLRQDLLRVVSPYGGSLKIVEVPPGPPVLSPLVAEIYGLDYPGQIALAGKLKDLFESAPEVVDTDDSVQSPAPQLNLSLDRSRAALFGVSQQQVVEVIGTLLSGRDVTYLHTGHDKYAVPLRLELDQRDKDDIEKLLAVTLTGAGGQSVRLADVLSISRGQREQAIYHKDILPVVYVTADVAGKVDSPLYGMFDLVGQVADGELPETRDIRQYFIQQPENPYQDSIKWDGEWQITYETFRDMGIAYSVGLLLIYLLIVAQFHSYLVPLIIMAPIPLTIIGVMPGHALLGQPFTATSMIGMIALAGIIVRNSILLVDFVNSEVASGIPFKEAVLRSGAVRAKPIILTGLAAMLGALFILDDPIFSGLAISLIFGILVSTVLTLVVIPVLYYALRRRRLG